MSNGKVVSMPNRAEVTPENIPEDLKKLDRWVLWKFEQKLTAEGQKWTKPPYQPNGQRGSHSNPQTWSSFQTCLDVFRKSNMFHGIGFVMGHENIVAWDLDHVLNPKTLEIVDWAQEIVDELNSYTEITPSGEGLRIFVRGEIPKRSANTRGLPDFRGTKEGGVETYNEVRFVTLTGFHWPKSPQSIELRSNVETIWKKAHEKKPVEVKTLLKNELMAKLWAGEYQDIMRPGTDPPERMYGSQSEADLALVRQLIISTEGDAEAADRLYRMSKLMRPKWDELGHFGADHCEVCRGKGALTFGQHTLAVALKSYNRTFNLTDVGNAKRFASLCGDSVRYCDRQWYVWDGKRVGRDDKQSVYLLADRVSKDLTNLATDVADEDRRKAILKHARGLESRAQIENMLKLAQSRPPIPVLPDELDQHDDWFCCENGVIEHGIKLHEHRFDDLITKISPIKYDPRAKAKRWLKFMEEIQPDPETRRYLQKGIGYSMTGSLKEQKFFLCYGKGQNGKSKFFYAIKKVFGDYFSRIPTSALMETRSEQHPTNLMPLKGARLTLASEVKEGRRLNEELIKAFTGEDEFQARSMFQNLSTIRMTSKLWIMSNHKPTITGNDFGMWRRVVEIPFTVTIPEHMKDPDLEQKFDRELEGILAWCVEGWRMWLQEGLSVPKSIKDATESYRAEMDVIQTFIDEECEDDPQAKTPHSVVYGHYTKWSERNGERPMSTKAFSSRLSEKKDNDGQIKYEKALGGGGVKCWVGIKLKRPEREDDRYENL